MSTTQPVEGELASVTSMPPPLTSGEPWSTFFAGGDRLLDDLELHQARYRRCVGALLSFMPVRPGTRLLDFGCGDALAAPLYLERGFQLTLYDSASGVRDRLARTYAGVEAVRVVSPTEYEGLELAQFDVITVHSVLQYIPRGELPRLLRTWHALLRPGGVLLLSDVITARSRMLDDALSLLAFGAHEGRSLVVLQSIVRALCSSYGALYRKRGLTRYSEGEMLEAMDDAGFIADTLPVNPGPFVYRRAFRGMKSPPTARLV